MNPILAILLFLSFLFPAVGLFGIFFSEGKKGIFISSVLVAVGLTTIPWTLIKLHEAFGNTLLTAERLRIDPAYALYGIPAGLLVSYIAVTIKGSRKERRESNQAELDNA
jgi:Na+(H+)/acetate symporter ActP